MDENDFYKQTVQHLARCLSCIDPTPWEKVGYKTSNVILFIIAWPYEIIVNYVTSKAN